MILNHIEDLSHDGVVRLVCGPEYTYLRTVTFHHPLEHIIYYRHNNQQMLPLVMTDPPDPVITVNLGTLTVYGEYTLFQPKLSGALVMTSDSITGSPAEINWIASYNIHVRGELLLPRPQGEYHVLHGRDFIFPPYNYSKSLSEIYTSHGVPYFLDRDIVVPL